MNRDPSTSAKQWERIDALFHAAIDLPPDHREAFVVNACDGDHALLDKVNRLLASHSNDDDFLTPPSASLTPPDPDANDATLSAHHRIGEFEIVRVIASGGMGTVYEAIQDHPQRTVALKVLRAGCTSGAALRRFRHESQVLGRLRHPGIAQVYAAGTCQDGATSVPYFAMEHIPDAKSIVEYAEANDLDIGRRLQLFVKVCDAVHHGHLHGIIHRDLKPANIIVDEAGRPKVIDFGVARVTDSDVAITTVQTSTGQLIGTLAYMSPQQCGGDPFEVDTRSDVYSLGVVLFELLCGCLPYDVRNRAIPEAARAIQEESPKRPSTIRPALRGDIDTIILKALEKEPDRRYDSATQLAADIRRCLNNEPLLARPPSMPYHLRLFARRNRAAVFAIATVLFVLAAASIVSTTFAFKATRAASGEGSARDAAQRVSTFLEDMIASAGTYRTGRHMTVLEMLDDAADRVHTELTGQPEAEAGVRYSVGKAYTQMWLWEDAVPHLKRALALNRELHGTDHASTADCLNLLGRALVFRNDPGAVAVLKECLAIRHRLHGPNHELVAETMGDLANALWEASPTPRWKESQKHYDAALAIYRMLDERPTHCAARITFTLATMQARQGRLTEAENNFRNALSIYRRINADAGVEDAYMAQVMYHFAGLLQRLGKPDEASELLRESREITPEGLAQSRSYDTSWRLGSVHHNASEFAAAEARYRESLAMQCRWLTRDFPEHSERLLHLESTLVDAGGERPPYREAFRAIRELRQWGELEQLRSMHDLGDVLQHTDPAAGAPLLRDCLRIARKHVAPLNWFIADIESIRGGCLTSLGQYEEAEILLLESYPFIASAPTHRDARLREALQRIETLYLAWNKPDRAAEFTQTQAPAS